MKKKKEAKKGSSPMDTALKFLTSKARTIRETEYHLDACHYAEYDVYATVERLKELGYLDDKKYAEDFIATRLATKPFSRRHLYDQLLRHEIDVDIINEALLAIDDECELKNALTMAEKFYTQFNSLDERQRKNRTASRLISRGYQFSTVRKAMEIVANSPEFELCEDDDQQ